MNINLGYGALKSLNSKKEKFRFLDLYEKTPEEFIEECKDEWNPDNLNGKYVVSVQHRFDKPKFALDGLYCIEILGVYTPREDQIANLNYYGHISFIDVKDKNNKSIALLYKDDECFPESMEDWWNNQEFDDEDAELYVNGKVPTKEEFIKLIKLVIIGVVQDPTLELDITEDDIIILQGL